LSYQSGGVFNNAGTLTKSNGATDGSDDSTFTFAFNNTGTVNVNKGKLAFGRGGTNTKTFNIALGATLWHYTGDYTYGTGNSVTGTGNLLLEAGTVTVAAASTWSAPVVLTGATLTGVGALTISNKLNWSGGTITGIGKKTVSGALNLLNGYQSLDGTTLETSGATLWTGTGSFYGYNSAIWNNTSIGTIDLQGDADLSNQSGGVFNNAGTFTKSNGVTDGSDESFSNFVFNNTGTVNVKKGTLRLTGGGTNSKTFNIDLGATLKHTSDYTYNTGSSVTGTGNLLLGGGTVTVAAASMWSASVMMTGGTLTGTGALTLSNKLSLSGGTITGAGILTLSELNWSGGTISGTGKKTVSGALNLSGYQSLDGTTLETSGATIWTGNGQFYGYNNATWNNTSTGTIDLQGDADLSNQSGGVFNNAGTFTKSNGVTDGSDESFSNFVFNNTGTVNVKKGTLRLTGGGTNSKTFNIDLGATLKHTSDYTYNTGSSVTGTGNLLLEGGTVTVAAASTWSAPVVLTGATLTGTGALTISNKLNWSGGTITGTGKKTVSGALNLSGYQSLDGTTLETSGATIWTGNGQFYGYNNATWNNTSTGTIDLQGDADLSNQSGGVFNNAGTFTKSNGVTDGSDESFSNFVFNNTGTVEVKKGKLAFNGGYNQTAGTTRLNGGDIGIGYNYTLELKSGVLTGAGTITGNVNNTGGQVNPGNTVGTLAITGNYSQSGTGILNFDLASASSFDKFNVTGEGNFGGTLKVTLGTGYTPTIGTKFTVLTYGTATAKTFNTVQGIDLSAALALAPTSTGNNLILEVVDKVPDLGAVTFGNAQSITDAVGDSDLFDFYRFNVSAASTVQLKLTNLTANADIWLVDGLGRTLAQGTKAGTADEVVSWAVDAGTYFVKVFRPAAGNNTNYALQIATTMTPTTWPLQFGTSGADASYGVTNDSAGSIFASGYTNGTFAGNTNNGSYDGYITKYNRDGSQAWIKQFGTPGTDVAFGIGNDSAGNLYTTGHTNNAFAGATNFGSYDGFITKYTSAGTLAWVKQFGTTADDLSYGISVDSAGNSYVVGKTSGAFTGNVTQGSFDAYIAKYDTNGNQTWVKQFGTAQDDQTTGISLDSSNNVYVSGYTNGVLAGNTNADQYDVFVSKYNSSGTQSWIKQLGTAGNDYADLNSISTDTAGNAFITGYTDGTFSGNTAFGSYDSFIAKYSTTGTLAWVKQFGTSSSDYCVATKTDSAGNVYVTGWTNGQFVGNTALGGYDAFIAKYNTSGTQLWVKQFGTTSDDYATNLSLDNLGNIYIYGLGSGSFPNYTNQGGEDAFIALFDTNGNQLSVAITPAVITVAASDPTAAETLTGTTANPGVFTLTRNGEISQALTVTFTLTGAALNGTDYTTLPLTATFAAGSKTKTVSLSPIDDLIFETSTPETAILTLTAGSTYTLGTAKTATINITDNDLQPTIKVNDVTVTEGNSGTTSATFTVALSNSSSQVITVNYATANGTATIADLDYANTTGILTFAVGETSKTVTVLVHGDIKSENPENFTVNLTNPTNATILDAQGLATISNDDLPVLTVTATDASAAETATGVTANLGTFTLTRTGDLTQAIAVNYTLAGTAINGTDYTTLTGTVTFVAGASTAIVTVTPTDDTVAEAPEIAILTLTSGTGYNLGTTNSATVNIADNETPVISVVATDANAAETATGVTLNPGTFTLTRLGNLASALTVNYTLAGTATNGTDYTNIPLTATFLAGASTVVVTVTPIDDTVAEAPETAILTLTSGTGYSLGTTTSATVNIADNEIPLITLAATDASAAETATGVTPNPGTFTLTRLGNLASALTVNYTLTGSATNGTDYTNIPLTATFLAGASTAVLTVTPIDDTVAEAPETAILTLTSGTGYSLGTTTSATVNIADNETPVITVVATDASAAETATGVTANPGTFTLTRFGNLASALTVNYTLAGAATNGTDYTNIPLIATFVAGSSTALVNVNPVDDTSFEGTETVILNLATGMGYSLGTTNATVSINDNDTAGSAEITVSAMDANAAETATGVTPNSGTFTFARTGNTISALSVNYTLSGTALNTSDYATLTGTVTFAANASTATINIDAINDTIFETGTPETVILTLATGTGYTLGTAKTGTVSISDNDSQPLINLSANQTVVEGLTSPQNVSYTVTLSNASSQIVTVNYATANGTALAGSDYTNTSGILTFGTGVTSQTINIPILNDSLNEANETFTLNLTSPINATLGTSTVSTTITDTLTSAVTTTLTTNVENLTLTGTAVINGTGHAGVNILTGNSVNNTLTGLDGNDTYVFVANSLLGTDTINETATGGIDAIAFTGTSNSVNLNLGVITSQTVNSNLKLILSANNVIENATGGTGSDRLTGNSLNNALMGDSGNDQLQGLAGDDILWGGLGDDLLTGGLGKDTYLFQGTGAFTSTLGVDYITQFEQGQDLISLSKTTFGTVTNLAGQALTDFAVVTDDEFVDANAAHIIYSQSTGSLFYNQNGNVISVASVFEFARLGNPDITLAATNFSLIG
jgi:Ca2+-binding RTX toxin-like protein